MLREVPSHGWEVAFALFRCTVLSENCPSVMEGKSNEGTQGPPLEWERGLLSAIFHCNSYLALQNAMEAIVNWASIASSELHPGCRLWLFIYGCKNKGWGESIMERDVGLCTHKIRHMIYLSQKTRAYGMIKKEQPTYSIPSSFANGITQNGCCRCKTDHYLITVKGLGCTISWPSTSTIAITYPGL